VICARGWIVVAAALGIVEAAVRVGAQERQSGKTAASAKVAATTL
jgi:hypothetical protein